MKSTVTKKAFNLSSIYIQPRDRTNKVYIPFSHIRKSITLTHQLLDEIHT